MVPEPEVIDVLGKVSGLGIPTTVPSFEVKHCAVVGTTLPVPTISPACCSPKFSVPFLIGRPEGPSSVPVIVPPYAVAAPSIRIRKALTFDMVGLFRKERSETAAATH